MGYLAFERGSSSHTVEAYGRDLERYVKALEEKGVTEPDDVTRPLIEEHLEHLAEEGYAPSSVVSGILPADAVLHPSGGALHIVRAKIACYLHRTRANNVRHARETE